MCSSDLELAGAKEEELREILGRARAKRGMFEGDMEEGELEIGQVSSIVNEILPAKKIVDDMIAEYKMLIDQIKSGNFDIK